MSVQVVARAASFAHGPVPVLDKVDLTLAAGDRVGVVGPNGAGKTTLLRLLAGTLTADSGSVERVPADGTVGHLTQELDIIDGETVHDVLARRTGIAAAAAAFDEATAALGRGDAGADERYSVAFERWMRLGVADADVRADSVLDRVGLGAAFAAQPASTLSGGQRARVNLASVLLAGFDALLLDEPTNDLDLDGLALLEQFLLGLDVPCAVVSHDRTFLERVVNAVVEIDGHSRQVSRYEGGWHAYLARKAVDRRHAEEDYATYVERRSSLTARTQRTHEWSAKGIRQQRRSPDDGDKLLRNKRVEASEKLASKAKQTERALDRLDVVDKPWEGWELQLDIAEAPRSGARVIECRELEVERRSFCLGPIDLDVSYGERLALVGVNGSGKTTLLQAVLGRIEPDRGHAGLGASVVVGELDQARRRFESDSPLIDVFVDQTGVVGSEARSQLAKLGLGPEHIRRPTGALSPGERTRAVLAAFALVGVNLLVLDEPTNHLDLPAIEQLEQALSTFGGTVVLVTHDRRMLETVTLTRRIELRDGLVVSDQPLS